MHSLVLMALEQEAPELAARPDVFFSGVGKVNAAMHATALIMTYRPRTIINFGTAGGITVGAGLHRCTRFVQRDMRCEALGFAVGETPYQSVSVIDFAGSGLICATGDSFVAGEALLVAADIVDMEAYAIARACWHYGVEFQCWKYVTDQADSSAHLDWRSAMAQGQKHYIRKLQDLAL